jgi:hypothetical protein
MGLVEIILMGCKSIAFRNGFLNLILINRLKPKLIVIIFKYSILNPKKTQPMTITKMSRLILFKKIIVYPENQMKRIYSGQNS